MGGIDAKNPEPGMQIEGRLGTYKLVEDIGRGGNGRVFSVEVVSSEKVSSEKKQFEKQLPENQLPEGESFVIKILKTRFRSKTERKKREKRFEKEIRTVCKIQNEIDRIIPIYDASCFLEKKGKFTWYLMPRAVTYDFAEIRTTEEKLKDMLEIGECIAQLHKRNIVHRDIKPQNLLVYNNKICLADFGLVRNMGENEEHLTEIYEDMGPAAIRPPEMRNIVNPDGIDYQKSDVYLFAKTVWIVLTGVKEGFYEEYKRSEKRIYLDKTKLRVETAEPLHEMLESATRHDWWDRIDINQCVRHIDDQLRIITKRANNGDVGKWKYAETIKEIGETILPDKKIYQGAKSVLNVLGRMAGAVNLVFKEAGKEYDPLFLKSAKLSQDNLLELDIKSIYYGNRRKIIVEIEGISIDKDLDGVMKTKIISIQPDNKPIFTNLNKALQSLDKQICISGIYEIRLVQT